MTKGQIIEGNKLIADSPFASDDHKAEMQKMIVTEGSAANFYYGAKYHSSWGWLMPVVEKISAFKYDNNVIKSIEDSQSDYAWTRTFGMRSQSGNPMVRINRCPVFEADTLIEATLLAVVYFIKWHKSQ